MNAGAIWSSFRSECSATLRYCLGLCALSWLLVLMGSTAYAGGDISLRVAKEFSFYSSGNCQKIDVPRFDVVLKCEFRGKRAEFFLQENPTAGFPLIYEEKEATGEAAEGRLGVDPPELRSRIKLWGGSAFQNDREMVFSRYGFLYAKPINSPGWIDTMERRVLIRTHFHRSYGAATLTVLSDFDQEALRLRGAPGVPEEVMTMFGSLGLKHSRLPQP